MKTFYSLINEYHSLIKGKLYKKKIKGKEYYYLQTSENGKVKSTYIPYEEVKSIQEQIKRREELKNEIEEMMKGIKRNITLSASMRSYTGYVMKEDKIVATFDKGILTYINEDKCPLIIKRTHSLNEFLKLRVIDSSRTNARLLKKILNIKSDEDELVSLSNYASSISDNYWFKPKNSKLKYDDISFTNDIFFDLSLKGIVTIYPNKNCLTPDLTTTGSFEKGWRYINGTWYLYKSGKKEEIFSELFYSTLLDRLNVPTVKYELEDGYIKSKNFADIYNFEPIFSYLGRNDDYSYVYNQLLKLDENIAKQYLVLIYFDTLLYNVDRHNENYGLLRDKKTGKIISLAPNFDNNLSLISLNKILNTNKNEGFLSLYLKFINSNKNIKEAYKEISLPIINKGLLLKCFPNIDIDIDKDNIITFILNRYEWIKEAINK